MVGYRVLICAPTNARLSNRSRNPKVGSRKAMKKMVAVGVGLGVSLAVKVDHPKQTDFTVMGCIAKIVVG